MIPVDLPYRRLREMSPVDFWLAHCRFCEQIALAFFIYTALLSAYWGLPPWKMAAAFFAPILVFGLACLETARGSTRSTITREWLIPGVVLLAYWQMGWFASGHDPNWEAAWLNWDRQLLDNWGLREVLERRLSFLPWWLELSYLLLYAIPPACMAILYWRKERFYVERFLSTFALGTLTAYALLPMIAVESPRLAFPGQDLPAASSIWRSVNLWILNHLDISTSVFPSGHVAVAFSSAFGIRRAMPASPWIFACFLVLACLVLVATVYGRYHYAADGLASLVICVVCWRLLDIYDRRH
jgi:hypothetical protein